MATEPDYIVGLQSENIEKITDFELTLGEEFKPFIVLTGDNGVGKTLLLEYIFKAIVGYNNLNSTQKGVGEITVNCNNCKSKYKYIVKESKNYISLDVLMRTGILSSKIAAYNANRLRIHSESSDDIIKEHKGNSPFSYDRLLRNGEHWLKMKLLAGRKELAQQGMQVLQTLMPNITKIDYRQDDKVGVVFQYHTNNGIESIQTISAGNKVILVLIGDLFFRLWDNQLDVKEAKDLTGIVIIDEIEVHLHPEWQRKFPQLLAKTFPKVQFVVSTHTPMTILGLPKNSILLHVDNNEEGKITVEKLELDFWNMLPQQILTSPIFGLESLRSLYNEDLEELNTEEDYKKLLENKKVQDNMKRLLEQLEQKK